MRLFPVHCFAVLALVVCVAGCEMKYIPPADNQSQTSDSPRESREPARISQAPTRAPETQAKPSTPPTRDAQAPTRTAATPPGPASIQNRPADAPIDLQVQPADAAVVGYRLGWASPIQLIKDQRIASVTVVGDMVIVIEKPENTVTALRASDGEFMWKKTFGSRLESFFPPFRDGRKLFIHSGTRIFTLEARTGKVTAVANLDTTVAAPAVYSPDTRLAIFCGVNGLCFAHSVDNNFSRWRYKMANRTSNSAVLAGQDIFLVDTGGTYALVEGSSGRPLWRNHTLGPVTAAPAIQDSEIIVASEDGKLYAINRTTGRDTWQYLGAEQPLSASPVVLGRMIVQPLLPKKGAIAIDAITGKEMWRSEINANPVLTRNQDMVLFSDNALITLNLNDGKVVSQVPTKPLLDVVPLGDSGAILLVSPQGRITRLSPI